MIRNGGLVLRRCLFTLSKANSRKCPMCDLWELPVDPYWKLTARLQECNIKIVTSDPVEGNKDMKVAFYRSDPEDESDIFVRTDKPREISISNVPGRKVHFINIETPVPIDLDITIDGHGWISALSLETDSVKVITDKGDVSLDGIKSRSIAATSKSGNITSQNVLQGNLCLLTGGKGFIKTDKLQGPLVELTTEAGDVTTKDVYCDDFASKTKSGNVNIKGMHGKSDISTDRGSVFVGTADGHTTVSAPSGDIDIFLADHHATYLRSNEGSINISTSPQTAAKFNLEAAEITVDKNLIDIPVGEQNYDHCQVQRSSGMEKFVADLHGPGGPSVRAISGDGKITVVPQSWWARMMQYQKFDNAVKTS